MSDGKVTFAGPAAEASTVVPAPPAPPQPVAPPPTPSAAIAASTDVHTVTDSRGRALSWKKLGVLERVRVFQILGPADSQNVLILQLAIPAAMCLDINGVALPPLTNSPSARVTLDARMEMLGDDGLQALDEHIAAVLGKADVATGADLKK